MLIDHAKIYVYAGAGGNGCNSLYKDMFNRRGVRDGGDGGDGGNIIFETDPNLTTLLDFKYNQHYRAGRGAHGGSNKKVGKRGVDLIIKVPLGTVIKDAGSDLVIRDLSHLGESVIAARGGQGGRGNAKKDEATEGSPGEKKTLILDLKLMADAGIIGFPNAGKSTLVSRISKSQSKIAAYPFTTKSPKLGVVKIFDDTFVVSDMPGLIEGAHEGKGLGDRFLRHIERTSVLVHVVDLVPLDGTDPAENFFKLENELKLYNEDVYNKPRVVAANKMDSPGAEEALEAFRDKTGKEVYPVSALAGNGLEELIKEIYREIKNVKERSEESNDKSWDAGSY